MAEQPPRWLPALYYIARDYSGHSEKLLLRSLMILKPFYDKIKEI